MDPSGHKDSLLAGQVQRECEFPVRNRLAKNSTISLAEENRERLVKRVVALVATLSNEDLYASYEEARESDRGQGKEKP